MNENDTGHSLTYFEIAQSLRRSIKGEDLGRLACNWFASIDGGMNRPGIVENTMLRNFRLEALDRPGASFVFRLDQRCEE
jgi:hypothetical protein